MNISITGTLGSGKSSVCKILKEKGFEIVSNGILFRELAAEKGVSVVELNKMAETDKSIDKMLDERSAQLGKSKDWTVFDARMGWHFIPDSYKVFLTVNINEAAARVYADDRVSEHYSSVDEAKKDLLERQLLEKERYLALYGVDYLDLSNYDLVIESTAATPQEVADQILACFEQNKRSVLLNPTSLYPSKNAGDFDESRMKAYIDGEQDQFQALPNVVIRENNFVVTDEHDQLLKGIYKKDTFIRVNLLHDDSGEPADMSVIQKLENLACFHYKFYPEHGIDFLSLSKDVKL